MSAPPRVNEWTIRVQGPEAELDLLYRTPGSSDPPALVSKHSMPSSMLVSMITQVMSSLDPVKDRMLIEHFVRLLKSKQAPAERSPALN